MPITYPPAPLPDDRLTEADAGAIMRKARKLLRKGRLSAKQLVLIDCLIWGAGRRHGRAACRISLTALQQACHMARETVSEGTKALAALGLVRKVKTRLRVAWANGGTATRQGTNTYVLIAPDTESSAATVIRDLQIFLPFGDEAAAAMRGLEATRRRRAVELALA